MANDAKRSLAFRARDDTRPPTTDPPPKAATNHPARRAPPSKCRSASTGRVAISAVHPIWTIARPNTRRNSARSRTMWRRPSRAPLASSSACPAGADGTNAATRPTAARYETASTSSTCAGPISATSSPPTAGPTKLAVSFTEPRRPPTRVMRTSSSPTSPASTRSWEEAYAGKNAPMPKPTTRSTGNDSAPAQCSTGISATSGARARSDASIARRGPSAVAARPLGTPSTVIPANSAAMTAPIRTGEPVVTSTNHGRAIAAISVPVVETTSATNRATSDRRELPTRRMAGGV